MSQLIEAAKTGDLNGVRKHLTEAKTKGPGGWTALMHAVNANHQSCAELLVQYEAGFQNDTGQTALMLAVDQGMTQLIPMLIPKEGGLKNRNGWTALMLATSRGNNEYAKLLLCEAGVQSSKPFNNTPALTSAPIHAST
ncbi:Ankyrin repeat protein 1 [Giardia muris]|uniref:Ankyrin repeat protein 1 n=1 Tax=Giardia muris TaxID=5742 RepID=A0A4Z1SNB7_GIAMU|nr:Ankyrin repeat protein 1 [Giardia muris]|eukprot:TNJ26345.1 Ankyrin repeat protein 1 [Giardia muris]